MPIVAAEHAGTQGGSTDADGDIDLSQSAAEDYASSQMDPAFLTQYQGQQSQSTSHSPPAVLDLDIFDESLTEERPARKKRLRRELSSSPEVSKSMSRSRASTVTDPRLSKKRSKETPVVAKIVAEKKGPRPAHINLVDELGGMDLDTGDADFELIKPPSKVTRGKSRRAEDIQRERRENVFKLSSVKSK